MKVVSSKTELRAGSQQTGSPIAAPSTGELDSKTQHSREPGHFQAYEMTDLPTRGGFSCLESVSYDMAVYTVCQNSPEPVRDEERKEKSAKATLKLYSFALNEIISADRWSRLWRNQSKKIFDSYNFHSRNISMKVTKATSQVL